MYVANPLERPSNVFLYTLAPTRPAMLREGATEAERVLAAQHWAYSQDLLAKKIVIFAGRTLDTTEDSFAIAVIRANSEAEARAIMEADPAVQGGLFRAFISLSADAHRRVAGARVTTAAGMEFIEAARPRPSPRESREFGARLRCPADS